MRTSTGVRGPRSRPAVLVASPTSRLAPRDELHLPLRSRCATITGAEPAVVRVASNAFRLRIRL